MEQRRRWGLNLLVVGLMVVVSVASASAQGPRVKVREAHTDTLFMAPVYIAEAAGYMADISFRTVMAIIEALADGSLYTTDTARAEALVVSPDSASLFWKCVVARPYTLENYNFCREKYGLSPVSTVIPPRTPWSGAYISPKAARLVTRYASTYNATLATPSRVAAAIAISM